MVFGVCCFVAPKPGGSADVGAAWTGPEGGASGRSRKPQSGRAGQGWIRGANRAHLLGVSQLGLGSLGSCGTKRGSGTLAMPVRRR